MIAGALNFIGADALYGRNWGAIEHHPFLHFEACYYQAIEFAIAHGLARVEAARKGRTSWRAAICPSHHPQPALPGASGPAPRRRRLSGTGACAIAEDARA